MTQKKGVVESYFACFNRLDWHALTSLVTDDIERWEPGAPGPVRGKKELEEGMRPGPDVTELHADVARTIEEGDVAVAEGKVRISLKDGKKINVQFCTIFEFERDKIRRITAFSAVL